MARIWACADILSAGGAGAARPSHADSGLQGPRRGGRSALPLASRAGPLPRGRGRREGAGLPPPGFPGGKRSGKVASRRTRCRRLAPPHVPLLPLPPAPATRARRRERKPARTRPALLRPLRDVSADGPRRSPIGHGPRRSGSDAPRGGAADWAAGLGPWGTLIGQGGPRGRCDVTVSGSAAAPGPGSAT